MVDFSKFVLFSGTLKIGLNMFFGIGLSQASQICQRIGCSESLLVSEVPPRKFLAIKSILNSEFILEARLKFKISDRLRSNHSIQIYRGIRLARGLPVRGQRTRSNGKTVTRMQKKGFFKF